MLPALAIAPGGAPRGGSLLLSKGGGEGAAGVAGSRDQEPPIAYRRCGRRSVSAGATEGALWPVSRPGSEILEILEKIMTPGMQWRIPALRSSPPPLGFPLRLVVEW